MSLTATNLLIQSAPLPATFKGDPNAFRVELVKRLKILSPSGTNFIFIGDVEPTSNVGPWLKNGTQWWVWDDSTKRYIPLDLTASETIPFFIGATTPTSSNPPIWLLTTQDATDQAPTNFGSPIGWYLFNGTAWTPFNSITLSGPTAQRPPSPAAFQQFYDTDIACFIWWERGMWRTVSGSPGDVKAVYFSTLTDALTANPGWQVLGAGNAQIRGRIIMQAAKDAGLNPQTILTVAPGVPVRGAQETFGETDGVQINESSSVPYPPQLALWHLVKT
jgi:hypothetical protein